MAVKNLVMNATRKAVSEVLGKTGVPMTLADISNELGYEVKTGTTNAMVNAGLMVKAGEVEVATMGSRKVATYTFVSEPSKDTKVSMTETRVAILNTLKNATEPMTLAEIASALGMEKLNSGVVVPMLNAEFMANVGSKKVPAPTKKTVATYVLGNIEA